MEEGKGCVGTRVLTVAYGVDDLREDLEAAHRAVDLPPRVVRDDDASAANFVSFECVRDALDAFHHERAAAGYAVPLEAMVRSVKG